MTSSPSSAVRSHLRVVLVTNSLPEDQLGGLQSYVGGLATALVRAGVEVTVLARKLSPDAPALSVRDGAKVLRRGFVRRSNPLYLPLLPLRSAMATASVVRRAPADVIVHGHFPVQAAPLIAVRGRPFVYTFHSPAHRELLPDHHGRYLMPPLAGRLAESGLRAVEAGLLRRADRIVVLSRYMRDHALSLAPAAEGVIEIVPGGLDLERFTPAAAPPDRWADDARPLLFTARRLVSRTGVRELVEAMPSVLSRHPAARLAIAGSGPLHEEIERAVRRLGLEASVRVLGAVSEEELLAWYRRADLMVLPTRELEGFGLAAIEAMACGTPVLSTRAGALPDVIGPLGDGFLADGSTAADLAAALNTLLDQPGLLADGAKRARSCVDPRYGWTQVADRHLALYEAAREARLRA